MKININRKKLVTYTITGCLTLLTLVLGCKYSSESKNNRQAVNLKDDKQYEESNPDYDVSGYPDYDVSGYPGYHLEGLKVVKNTDEPTLDDGCIRIPEGYVLENRNGMLYAVKRTTYTIPADVLYDEEGNIHYSIAKYPGFTLVGDKGVKTDVEEFYIGIANTVEPTEAVIEHEEQKQR